MSRRLAGAAGVVLAALLSYGVVTAGMDLTLPRPAWTPTAWFQPLVLACGHLFVRVHGPDALVNDFVDGLIRGSVFLCACLGFLFFAALRHHRLGWQAWKPFGIALMGALSPGRLLELPFQPWLGDHPFLLIWRVTLVAAAMIWLAEFWFGEPEAVPVRVARAGMKCSPENA